MRKRLVMFLIRTKLGLKKYEQFQFANQKSNAVYYFADDQVVKVWRSDAGPSSVSLNYLLSDECEIVRV